MVIIEPVISFFIPGLYEAFDLFMLNLLNIFIGLLRKVDAVAQKSDREKYVEQDTKHPSDHELVLRDLPLFL